MNREEIYDHLAQVYLGKRKEPEEKKQWQFNTWLLINVFIMAIIFASSFYGLTAFLKQNHSLLQSNIIFSLHNGPARIEYNFADHFPPVKKFSLNVPDMDASGYLNLSFSLRAREEGSPGIMKVVVRNKRNEISSMYVREIDLQWNKYSLPLSDFKEITDWSCLTEISFVLESWNVADPSGVIMIEDVNFEGYHVKKS
jgi:hypothetical protein